MVNSPGWKRLALAPLVVYASWLGMLAVHELGHVLHAVVSGGRVERIVFPLLGFSQTIVSPSPHETFVLWGGLLWGAALPAAVAAIVRAARGRVPDWLKFFVGFCLVANGSYLAIGWMTRNSGADPAELRRHGTPVWLMVAPGLVLIAAGLAVWHRTSWLTRAGQIRVHDQ